MIITIPDINKKNFWGYVNKNGEIDLLEFATGEGLKEITIPFGKGMIKQKENWLEQQQLKKGQSVELI